MTYQELVRKLQNFAIQSDASRIKAHVAVQINVYGEGEGALYIEIKDGRMDVQPYEYYDRDAVVYVDAKTLSEIADNKLAFRKAYEEHRLVVQGNHNSYLELDKIQIKTEKEDLIRSKHMSVRRLVRKQPQGRKHQCVLHTKRK